MIVLLYQWRGPYSNPPLPPNLSTIINIPNHSGSCLIKKPWSIISLGTYHISTEKTWKHPNALRASLFASFLSVKSSLGHREIQVHKIIDRISFLLLLSYNFWIKTFCHIRNSNKTNLNIFKRFSSLFVILNAISIMLIYIELNWAGAVIQRD